KTRRHLYQFTFRMRGGSVVMGSGRWERPSREDHPEFAWYPLMAVADNPEVAYDLVRQVLWNTVAEGAPDAADDSVAEGVDSQPTPGGAALAEPDSPAPACDAQLSQTRNDAAQTDTPQTDTPEAGEAESETPPPAAGAAPSADEPAPKPVLLSPLELAAMVTDKTSSFGLDVTVDRFDGGHYRAGETFIVRGVSARGGHLYLLHLDSRGDLTLLYPLAGQSNRVRAETPFVVPGDGHRFAFRALPPPGVNRIRAVVTQQPLELTGLVSRVLPKEKGTDQSLQDARQIFRWHPAQQQQIRQLLKQDPQSQADPAAELGAFDPRRILGPFAHDEVAFYVDAADTEPDASARPPANEE
ncbi:MAG: DUF4384 domain-containing protein, partial [Planctomycetes bacterium]|nr:DUF4384 domain-containing protein [Planctomycetota bacterium]